jgi:hypothetical protein
MSLHHGTKILGVCHGQAAVLSGQQQDASAASVGCCHTAFGNCVQLAVADFGCLHNLF